MCCQDNWICDEGACTLSEALKADTKLTSLYIIGMHQSHRNNLNKDTAPTTMNKAADGVGVEGGRALSEALKVNTALTELSLGSV